MEVKVDADPVGKIGQNRYRQEPLGAECEIHESSE